MSRNNSYMMGLAASIGRIEGLQEASKLLKNLPHELRDKVAQKALKAGAEPLLNEVIRRAPVGDTGNLASAVKISAPKPKRNLIPWASVITKSPHAHLVEFGHRLVKGTGLFSKDIGTVPEHPFMRPALDTHAAAASEKVAEQIAFWVQKLEGKGNKL